MGKFDGVLIASDFDNTMAYTEPCLLSGAPMPTLSAENKAALEYFMAEGGIFSVATGRALPGFDPVALEIPMNGPTVLFNGAAIYDYKKGAYVATAYLPEEVRGHIAQIEAALGPVTYKIYHNSNDIYVVHPNDITDKHQHLTHLPTTELQSVYDAPSPILKIVFEEHPARLEEISDYICHQGWSRGYAISSSLDTLLEVTAHGADKGGMVERLAGMLGIERQHVYCMGDHANDVSMLTYGRIAFAPENAIDIVKRVPGVRVMPHSRHNATAAMIAELDKIY